jgi:hypothetical protein
MSSVPTPLAPPTEQQILDQNGKDQAKNVSSDIEEHLKILIDGIEVKRVKQSKIHKPAAIMIDESQRTIFYPPSNRLIDRLIMRCSEKKLKRGKKVSSRIKVF